MAYVRHPRCITPPMTSATAPSPAVVASSSNYPDPAWYDWHAFDGVAGGTGTAWSSNGAPPQWISICLGAGKAMRLERYEIVERSDGNGGSPTAWVLQGGDTGGDWANLDARTGLADGVVGGVRSYSLAKVSLPYVYFRLYITAVIGPWAPSIAELQLIGPKRVTPLPLRGRSFLR